jgi:hypothetical protein
LSSRALVAQDPQAAPAGVLGRIVGGDEDPANPGLADRIGAGRGEPVMTAGLERDIHRRAAQFTTSGGADRLDLGVRRTQLAVVALADGAVVVGDHGSDERIGADPSASLLGDLDRAGEVTAIAIGDGCHLCFGE